MTEAAANGEPPRAASSRRSPYFLTGPVPTGLHVAVVAAGAALLLANAFNTSLWYDETYSVAMAWHSFADIWSIGADDVHPVLYYFALHALYLVFGTNVVAYRLLSLTGSVVLSALGLTHVRRDAGDRTGIAFSALAYFLPWSLRIAFQVRMYSWLAVAVMLAFFYGRRIVAAVAKGESVPCVPWIKLTAASVACAYLHYYGAMAAFAVQACVLFALVRAGAGRRAVAAWALSAAIAVVCYLPWLSAAVVAQASMVGSGSYWIDVEVMQTAYEMSFFPFNAPEFEHVSHYGYYERMGAVLLAMAAAASCIAAVYSFGKARGRKAGNRIPAQRGASRTVALLAHPAVMGVFVFAATVALAFLASLALGHPMVYYRYLTSCLGPLALTMAYVFAHCNDARVGVAALGICVACGAVSYGSLYESSHSPDNEKTLSTYEELCERAEAASEGNAMAIAEEVYTAGILAASGRGMAVTYVPETENPAFRAYEPRFVMGETLRSALGDFDGCAVFLGDRDRATQIARTYGGRILERRTTWHEYSGRFFDYALIDFSD